MPPAEPSRAPDPDRDPYFTTQRGSSPPVSSPSAGWEADYPTKWDRLARRRKTGRLPRMTVWRWMIAVVIVGLLLTSWLRGRALVPATIYGQTLVLYYSNPPQPRGNCF